VVRLLVDERETDVLVDPAGCHEDVVRPQHDASVAIGSGELDARVDEAASQSEPSSPRLDEQNPQLRRARVVATAEHTPGPGAVNGRDPGVGVGGFTGGAGGRVDACGIEVVGHDPGDEGLELEVPPVLVGVDRAVTADHPSEISRPDLANLDRRLAVPGPEELAQHGRRLDHRSSLVTGQRREQAADLGVGPRNEFSGDPTTDIGEFEDPRPGVLLGGHDRNEAGALEPTDDAGQEARIHAEPLAQVALRPEYELSEFVEHPRLGERVIGFQQPPVEEAEHLGPGSIEPAYRCDGFGGSAPVYRTPVGCTLVDHVASPANKWTESTIFRRRPSRRRRCHAGRVTTLRLTSEQIADYRLRAAGLDARAAMSEASLRRAVHAGLQDSWPRAALLSIHARVLDTPVDVLDDSSLTQVWGPRFNVYVVAERDAPYFTVGRRPESGAKHDLGQELADGLDDVLGDAVMPYRNAGRTLGVNPNQLRYAALTGRLRVRWEGAGAPTVRTVPAPDIDIPTARRELARRFLHAQGPSTPDGFGTWAGIASRRAVSAFDELRDETTVVETPIGEAVMLTTSLPLLDATRVDEEQRPAQPEIRLLPGGDSHFLRWGAEREVQVASPPHRADLWPTRVWPGALLVDGVLRGSWRRSNATMTVTPWGDVAIRTRNAVEAEAHALPLPGVEEPVAVEWNPPLG